MTTFPPNDDGRMPPLPLDEDVHLQPRAFAANHRELNELRASIESTIEQHLHERGVAYLLSNARTVLNQRASAPFHAVNGATYNTIAEFVAGVAALQAHEFAHHVNEQRNDFANWINDCFAEPASRIGAVLREKNQAEVLALLHRIREYSTRPAPKQALPAPKPVIPFEPLPPAPVSLPTQLEHVQSELARIQQMMRTDLPAARDVFIGLRTYIWQEMHEDDRKAVLPKLRDVYLLLVAAGK